MEIQEKKQEDKQRLVRDRKIVKKHPSEYEVGGCKGDHLGEEGITLGEGKEDSELCHGKKSLLQGDI